MKRNDHQEVNRMLQCIAFDPAKADTRIVKVLNSAEAFAEFIGCKVNEIAISKVNVNGQMFAVISDYYGFLREHFRISCTNHLKDAVFAGKILVADLDRVGNLLSLDVTASNMIGQHLSYLSYSEDRVPMLTIYGQPRKMLG